MVRSPDVTIVIACYNESGHLHANFNEIEQTMESSRLSHEYIFVDDCSSDDTRDIIKRIASGRDDVRYVFHETNKGRGAAVKTGLGIASGRVAGFLDVDLEAHCRYIPSMFQAVEEGADVVCGYRIYKTTFRFDDLLRDILSVGYRWMVRSLLKLSVMDSEAGYKFFNMETARPLIEMTDNDGWFWDTEVIALATRGGLRILEVPMVYIRRADKRSTVKPLRDSLQYLKELRRFRRRLESLPLKK